MRVTVYHIAHIGNIDKTIENNYVCYVKTVYVCYVVIYSNRLWSKFHHALLVNSEQI